MAERESPTLKVRLELADSMLGMECHSVAKRLVGDNEGVKVLDSKWGREPTKWRETGGGWGRNQVKLTDWERGFTEALTSSADGVERKLLDIIDRLIRPYPQGGVS